MLAKHSGLQSACDDREPPSPPVQLRAHAQSPYAVELTWDAAKDPDVAYYNVYAASDGPLAPVQDRRLASPTEPHAIDWGLRSGTDYRYLVTAVDRAGNESRPSDPVSVETPAIERFLAEVPVHQTLAQVAVQVDFTVPRDDTYVVWVQLQAKQVALGQVIQVRLDQSRPAAWKPMWDFVSIGHGDPEPVPFFDLVKTRTADAVAEPLLHLTAGRHQLSFILPRGTTQILTLTVTNDQGYLPSGITSFLAERTRTRR